MDATSKSASITPWHWVIEAIAGCNKIDTCALQDLIDVAPVVPNDLGKNTRELVAMRCLECLFGSAGGMNFDASSSLVSRVGLDFSQNCEDVLQQILHEIPLSNLKMAGAELMKWDVYPFIIHKRASTIKCELEQLKESVFKGTHPHTDYLKEWREWALQNADYQVLVNDGKCNNHPEKDNENCTYAESMGSKENAMYLILENGNKSSKEHLGNKSCLPSKRNRFDSADELVMGYLHEKQVGINECGDFLTNAKKMKCDAPFNIESKKDKRVSQHGKDVSRNSTERAPPIFEREGHHTEKDQLATLGEGLVLENCHDGRAASNCCRSVGADEVCNNLSEIPFNTTMMPQHTSGGEPFQKHVESITLDVALPNEVQHNISAGEPWSKHESDLQLKDPRGSQKTVADDKSGDDTGNDNEHHIEPIPTNIDDPGKIRHKNNKSQSRQEIDFQLKEPNAASQNGSRQLVASDEAVVDAFNGSGAEHNERINIAAKKHEFISSQYTSIHDFTASTDWREQNLCMKCNEGGQLLVCKTTTCPIKVHASCLGTLARFDAKGSFLCPICVYSHAISEYLEAKKKASLARKELSIFFGMDREHQATELHEVHTKENSIPIKSKCGHIHVEDNGNDQLPGTGREDNTEDHVIEHVNEVNNLQFERSQQQAEPCMSGDNILSSCREKEIVNNMMEKVLIGEEERGEMMNPESSTVREPAENQVPTNHVTVGDKLFCQEANFLCVNQINTGEEIQLEMLEQRNTNQTGEPVCARGTEGENIYEDEYKIPICSKYSMRSRKCETQYKPQAIPQLRRKKIPWTAEEEEMLREGMQKFGVSDHKIPWKQILEFGSHVFLKERRAIDLKDKWKNMCKASSKLN